MALPAIAFLPRPVTVIRKIGALDPFDAVVEEVHNLDLEITDSPLETGIVISDHAYMKPVVITIKAGVSDTPLSFLTTLKNIGDVLSNKESSISRSQKAFNALTDLQKAAEPIDVQTGLKLYTNMMVQSIRTKQDKNSNTAFIFDATLREVIIVDTVAVTYPPRAKGAASEQGDKTKNKGEQQGAAPASSLAKKLVNIGKGVFK